MLVAAIILVLPGVLFGGILLHQVDRSDRVETRAELAASAARAVEAVDRELGVLVMAARVLATSAAVAGDDLSAFAAEIRAAGNVLGQPAVLVALDDIRTVIDDPQVGTGLSDGAVEQIKRVLPLRRAFVSDLFADSSGALRVVVVAPVFQGTRLTSAVCLWLDPAFFSGLLRQQRLPERWIASVRDSQGRLVARHGLDANPTGMALSRNQVLRADGRVGISATLEGAPVLAAAAYARTAEWRVAVAIPLAMAEAAARRSKLILAVAGVATMVFGGAFAWTLARQISQPLSRLAEAGRDLGAGRDVARIASQIAEVQDVSAALTSACRALRERNLSLAAERAQLAAIIETVPVGLMIAEAPSGRIVAGNRQLARMLAAGSTGAPVEAVDAADQTVPAADMPLARALAGEDPAELRYRLRRADGSLFWVQAVASPIVGAEGACTGAVVALLDIDETVRARQRDERWTDQLEAEVRTRTAELEQANCQLRQEISARGRAEDQLRQAQKMDAVGRLTGGIAHDFNNLLTVILGSLDLLRHRVNEPRALRLVDSAADGANRAAELVSRLLAFSRRQPLLPQVVDVNHLVSAMSTLLRRSLGATIAVTTVLDDAVWQAAADPNQLENALLNLAVNARDAILETSPGGGRLRIETANRRIDAAATSGAPRAGDYVVIATIDTGGGMSPETLSQAFEPFFTTKQDGKGTGLGLSQVHGFAAQSGGFVTIESELGKGTAVSLFLPRARQMQTQAEAPLQTDVERAPVPGLTILLVEDEPAVRLFAADALRLLGYDVLEAVGGEQALALLAAHREVALMVTDVVMPGMNGRELAREAQRRRPGLPVLLASGFSRAVPEPGDADWDLLPKPFTVAALAAKVRGALRDQGDRVPDRDAPGREHLRMDA